MPALLHRQKHAVGADFSEEFGRATAEVWHYFNFCQAADLFKI